MRYLLVVIISGVFLLTPKVNGFALNSAKFLITTKASWYSANDPTDPFPHITNADGSRFNEADFTCAMRSRKLRQAISTWLIGVSPEAG